MNNQQNEVYTAQKSSAEENIALDTLDVIDLCDLEYKVTPLLFGGNLEHSRSAISGGLSAQMIRNRKFAGMPNSFRGNAAEWFIIGDKTFAMVGNDQTNSGNIDRSVRAEPYTKHSPLGYHMQRWFECNSQMVQNIHGGVAGIGQHGIYLDEKKDYEFRIVLRADKRTKLHVALTSHDGKEVYVQETIIVEGNEWDTYTVFITPDTTDADADIRITFSEKARIFVGAVSLMPKDHFCGMRKDVIACLKEMNIKMLRWPGGNFAGEYNWLDGLLPCDMRAPLESYLHYLTQPHTMGYDYHEINTDDFIALCREIGAEPSLTLNLTWNTPEENAAWVEYCNGDETTKYGRMRIDRGFQDPYVVKYWSLGNEAGYAHMEGDNTPAGYCTIAEENAKAMLNVDPELILCSSGCHPNQEWGDKANNKLASLASMAALHNYVNAPTYAKDEDKKKEMEDRLSGVEVCRKKIHEMRSYLSCDVDIAFDEWNCWYSWYRPQDTFAGIFAAKMFHLLIEEQKKNGVLLSAIYQPINEGCICVLSDRATLSPMGQVFQVMTEHSGGQVKHISDAVAISEKDQKITITLINESYDEEKTFFIRQKGKAEGIQLYAEDIGPYTNFSRKRIEAESKDDVLKITVPKLSISLLTIKA